MIIDNNFKPNMKPMPFTGNSKQPAPMPRNNNPIKPEMLVDNQARSINPLDRNNVANQSLTVLEQRYKSGQISIDEFKKGCEKISNNK